MQVDQARRLWVEWRSRAVDRDPRSLLDLLIADAQVDPEPVLAAAGPLDPASWLNFAPLYVGLTHGTEHLAVHPLASELDDARAGVLGHLFDPDPGPSWERILFLLGTAIGRGPVPIADVRATVFDRAGAMSAEDKALLLVLAIALRPDVAVEAGTFEGGSAALLAPHVGRLVTIDLDPARAETVAHLRNVEFVAGRADERLGPVLGTSPEASLVLLDADHGPEGVAAEVTAVLDRPTSSLRVVAIHDTAEPGCRAGLLAVDWDRPELIRLDLGATSEHPDGFGWGGMGLAVVASAPAAAVASIRLDAPRVARWPLPLPGDDGDGDDDDDRSEGDDRNAPAEARRRRWWQRAG